MVSALTTSSIDGVNRQLSVKPKPKKQIFTTTPRGVVVFFCFSKSIPAVSLSRRSSAKVGRPAVQHPDVLRQLTGTAGGDCRRSPKPTAD